MCISWVTPWTGAGGVGTPTKGPSKGHEFLVCLNKYVKSTKRKVFSSHLSQGPHLSFCGCDIQEETERAQLPQVSKQDWEHNFITSNENIPHANKP